MDKYLIPTLAEAKRYWKTGAVKSLLTKEAQRLFRMGQTWMTTKGGYPAVVSYDPDGHAARQVQEWILSESKGQNAAGRVRSR